MGIDTIDSVCNDPANIAPHIGVEDFLTIADMKLEDFTGKYIADIAGGAGLLSLYIQNESHPAHVVLIDQDLQRKSFEDIVQRAKKTFIFGSQSPAGLPRFESELLQISSQIDQVFRSGVVSDQNKDLPSSENLNVLYAQQEKGSRLVTRIKNRMENNKKNAELLDKYLNHEYTGVELNDSSGEHIVGIDTNSQDIIFINHILCILPDTYLEILKEADRILKPDGEIVIIDYPHYNFNGYGDYFRILCEKSGILLKENENSLCIKLKKGEYVKLQ